MTQEDIRKLAERVANGIATEEELRMFHRLCNAAQPQEDSWNEQLLGNKEEIREQIKETLWDQTVLHQPVVHQIGWLRWTAAAAVLVAVVLSGLFLLRRPAPLEANRPSAHGQFHNDVLPGHSGAVLTLSNGRQIILDSAQNGALAEEANAIVTKQGGTLLYTAHKEGGELLYNTMTTPKGRQYSLVLSDGTKVWLNAASSIAYPTAFAGKERRVMINGEAYFEVAHNSNMPFVVQKGNISIQVLGTHFNINSYEDEASFRVTLLEGSVQVQSTRGSAILKPGQQAQVQSQGGISTTANVDVGEVMAWKNGTFVFNGNDLPTIMRQLSRWYDVEIVYRHHTGELFYGEIPRNTKLSDVLKALELTGKIHFDIDGKKIIVFQ